MYKGDHYQLRNEIVGYIDYDEVNLLSIYLTQSGDIQSFLNRVLCKWLMERYSEFCNYTSISLFEFEGEMAQDLKYEVPLLDLRYTETQIVYYYNLTDEIKEYFLDRYINEKGEIRWFSFNYYISNKVHASVLSVDHCGEEYHLKLSNGIKYEEVIRFLEEESFELHEFIISRKVKKQ